VSYTDHNGEERKLGLLPPTAGNLARRKLMKSFGSLLAEKGLSLIPESQWIDVDYPEFHKPEFVLNQFNSSGCVGYSEAAAEMKIRVLRGLPFERLSGSFTYAHINGGQDGGAMILDAMESAAKYGHALESEFNYPKLFMSQIPSTVKETALTRQSPLAYPVDTVTEVATALQMGFIVQCGVAVDGNFERFDSNGVSAARGQYANHSVHLCGMKKFGSRWCYRMPNTWGFNWGPFGNGSCYLSADGLVLRGDAYVHVVGELPGDFVPVPA